jgi:hypothetical protein
MRDSAIHDLLDKAKTSATTPAGMRTGSPDNPLRVLDVVLWTRAINVGQG